MRHTLVTTAAILVLCACERPQAPAALGILRQALTCGSGSTTTDCGATPSFCSASPSNCDALGTEAHCCACDRVFACGSDCQDCPTRAHAIRTCAGHGAPAATSCGYTCEAGFQDTNGLSADGCEVTCNSTTACGSDCLACVAPAHAAATCSGNSVPGATACGYTCQAGFKDTNGLSTDGCETTCSATTACGSDCLACAVPAHAAATCSGNSVPGATACGYTCLAGFKDTNGLAADGCETTCSVTTACGSDCQTCPARANATATSCAGNTVPAATACTYTCLAGYRDANASMADGCEAACETEAACGTTCLPCATTHAASTSCLDNTSPASLACNPACLAGFANRDGNGVNGCEACGDVAACGTDCAPCAATHTTSVGCAGNATPAASACLPTCAAGYANADGDNRNGCEAACESAARCGNDCLGCAQTNASSTSCLGNTAPAASSCTPVCNAGFKNQDGNAANGCEGCSVASACGSDCGACAATHTTSVGCSGNATPAASACQPACAAGYANADGDNQNGCEATCNSATRCGTDCLACAQTNASGTSCQGIASAAAVSCVPLCTSGHKNLDGNGANGCEPCTSTASCGSNCLACQALNTSSTACAGNADPAATACQPVCASGFRNLDGNNANGCEARCDQVARCGSDCAPCQANHATVTCSGNTGPAAQACSATCLPGFANLDADHSNGCEVTCDTTTRCGRNCLACAQTNASATSCLGNTDLAATACRPTCLPGFADLDGNGANGCEAPCSTPSHCGSDCGPCAATNTSSVACSGSASPAASACRPTCAPGWANLDGNNQNGCEARCDQTGRCGTNCLACAGANASTTSCLGNGTPAGTACQPVCLSGFANLDGDGANGCEAPCTTAAHCGSDCGACSASHTSSVGCSGSSAPARSACRPVCAAGFANVDGDNQNACEAACDVAGRCGTDCAPCQSTNASATGCQGNGQPATQACQPTCLPGFANLDGNDQNACETTCDTAAHCGTDCAACSNLHAAVTSCAGNAQAAASACRPTCDPGWQNLDGNNANGCEAKCDQDGRCGTDCAACLPTNATTNKCQGNAQPAAQACQPTCKAGFADVDQDRANGCEVTCSVAAACGSDCRACLTDHTTATGCAGNTQPATSACQPTCAPGWRNLNGNNYDACEARCDTADRCGSDCAPCQATHASGATCAGNDVPAAVACRPACVPGFADADGDASNGCESPCNVLARCGLDCLPCQDANATGTSCASATQPAADACRPVCEPGFEDVDEDGANGCEAACDVPGRCGSDCRACALVNADSAACANRTEPATSACVPACKPGWVSLDGNGANGCEVRCDSLDRCGADCRPCEATHASVTACAGNSSPAATACRPTCEAGWADADGDAANGCEAACDQGVRCGLTCVACSKANAIQAGCSSRALPAEQACRPTCQPGFQDLDGDGLNGCEARCDQVERCGTTCAACPARAHATLTCAGSDQEPARACGFVCVEGYADKDPFVDGCETACRQADRCGSDCKACPPLPHTVAACQGNQVPSAQACSFTCQTGYLDANEDLTDGCEACAPGYWAQGASCARCDVDEHCGFAGTALAFCRDCTSAAVTDGRQCLSGRCGCDTDADCRTGLTCRAHSCVKACTGDGQCGDAERCCGPADAKVCLVWSDEVCDGRDNDCNGAVDDGLAHDEAPPCSLQQGVCSGARVTCSDGLMRDCDGARYAAHSADYEAVETRCDGKDNDCNGKTDEAPGCLGVDAGQPGPDASSARPFTGETYSLEGCGCQQGAAPGTLAALAVLMAGLRRRRRR